MSSVLMTEALLSGVSLTQSSSCFSVHGYATAHDLGFAGSPPCGILVHVPSPVNAHPASRLLLSRHAGQQLLGSVERPAGSSQWRSGMFNTVVAALHLSRLVDAALGQRHQPVWTHVPQHVPAAVSKPDDPVTRPDSRWIDCHVQRV